MFNKSSSALFKTSRFGLPLLASLFLGACSQPPKIEKVSGYAEGTSYHVSWWSKTPVSTEKVQQQFNKELAKIDLEFSTYRPDSYISKFNRSTSTQWQPASKDFIDMLLLAKKINQESHGCYDPTIEPLFALWGFQKDVLHVPTRKQIAAVKSDLGIDKIEIDQEHMRIRKRIPKLQLDLSSMGEGYAISKLSEILQSDGVKNYLVEFGGDMKIEGEKPEGQKWRVAIEDPIPLKDGVRPYRIVTINDESGVSLNTSGTYHHYFDDKGKDYSHILDPRTGAPVTHDLVSASVFGHNPIAGDAWATTMLCLGPIEGLEVAKKQGLAVYFIQGKGDKFSGFKSPALASTQRVTFDGS
ncbi:FAD:protein FMN transferase [Vibrio sp. S4M6]|uniref:FAD:protein FMN transferase n=1 Tax=Vibrio sinus TaxID=2946865 RepID=UPI00202A2524|nr:FAD:protein FMN transferase [Vibrio sinus]MCL9781177.1 FAD:protein FMN transferase [Vibrio sinus]